MDKSATWTGLSGLLAAALLAVGCTESVGPARRGPGTPQFDVAANGIALDQVNGTLPEQGTALLKGFNPRSEEHTSELQSQSNLVCRLLLEKKKKSPIYVSLQAQRCTGSCGATAPPT